LKEFRFLIKVHEWKATDIITQNAAHVFVFLFYLFPVFVSSVSSGADRDEIQTDFTLMNTPTQPQASWSQI